MVRKFFHDHAAENREPDMAALEHWLTSPSTQPSIIMLGGHFPFSRYAALIPETRLVTFLREPLARIVSLYAHKVREGRFQGTLLEFAAWPKNKNSQSWMLQGVNMEAALLVGITERYSDSLCLLQRRLGFAIDEIKINENPNLSESPNMTTPSTCQASSSHSLSSHELTHELTLSTDQVSISCVLVGGKYSLTRQEEEQLREWNLADIALYDEANKRLTVALD